jgi:predicted site-specific integrase-resolvase
MKTKVYLTRKETAELLRISSVTLDTYCKKGFLRRLGIGKRVLFIAEEVHNSLNEL